MKVNIKGYLHHCGSLIAISGILFVIWRIRDYGAQISVSHIGRNEWILIASLAVAYGTSNVILSVAWWHLISIGQKTISPICAIIIYGKSQLAKYVPGNIFHLASRQALGMGNGLDGKALAKSTGRELGLLAISGVLFGFLTLPTIVPYLSIPLSLLMFFIATTATYSLVVFFDEKESGQAFIWYVCFLLISAILFVSMLSLVSDVPTKTWSIVAGSYVLAWLIGLVTPGAPAGVGVRELVLVFLLHSFTIESELLLAVVIGRMVTVVGDFLFFIAVSVYDISNQKNINTPHYKRGKN